MVLAEQTPQVPLLIVGAARPSLFERRPYWGEGQTFHTLLELRPLTKRESRQLVSEILKMAGEIPTDLRELIINGAEGNPFYVEELIKMLIEDEVIIPDEEDWRIEHKRMKEVDVPSTLAAVLQARLDGLPARERIVLQQASVVGRLFWDRIVSYIQQEGGNGGDPTEIPQALISLRDRELVFRHEESAFVGSAEYLFKHDVLREVTYESVIKRLRKTYHGMVADWLIANCGDRINEYNGLIAEHLLLARRKDQACQYFTQAGESALAGYASSEAEQYYQEVLALSPPEKLRAEILSGLGEAYFRQGKTEEASEVWKMAIESYKVLEDYNHLGDIYARLSTLIWFGEDFPKAWEICQEGLKLLEGTPDCSGYASILAEGGRTALFADVTDQVIPLCQRAQEMAERVGDLEIQTQAKITMALNLDDPRKCIDILEEVLEIAEGNGLLRTALRAHHNISVILANDLLDLYSANKHAWRATEIAKQIGDNESLIFSLVNAGALQVDLGEFKNIEEKLYAFMQSSAVPKDTLDEIFSLHIPNVMGMRGEWQAGLIAHKEILTKYQDEWNIQQIIERRSFIANNVLEQNRFGYYDDLSEVESGLLDNIDQSPTELYSLHILVIVYIRQGRLQEARGLFAGANEILSQLQSNIYSLQFLQSKIDIEMALAEHRWEEVISACESSIESYSSGGFRWDTARYLIDLGDALIGRNEPGDLDRAREAFRQSLDMFTEMGAPGYVKVLEERLADPGQFLPGTDIGD
jgi:tetratricopeptide (TPR) repeat protein